MIRYWTLFFGIVTVFLVLFAAAHILGIDGLGAWERLAEQPGWLTGSIGVALLVLDVVLPIPSMVVMLGLGALFGTGVGALLCLVGAVAASLVAFGLGRLARGGVGRWVGDEEQRRADAMLAKWGVSALIMSRPMPLISETVAVMAGASEMSWTRAVWGSVIGSLPMCCLYSATGAGLGEFDHIGVVFLVVILLALLSWVVGRRFEESSSV